MSNVTLTIGGRHYTVACGPGEEDHIALLGTTIDSKIADMPGLSSQSDARTLLYAALILADELHESDGDGPAPAGDDGSTAEALETVAGRLEDLAARLEGSSWSA